MAHHVILGAGVAGLNAIETLRQFDAEGEITLISAESPYSRMALPYFVAGSIPAEQLATASEESLQRLRVEARIGTRAVAIDPARRAVRLDSGAELAYDTLLIATGSCAARPAIPGIDSAGVLNLWTLADAEEVRQRASGRPSATIIGAGFIGLILLNALHKGGWRLALIEQEGHILPKMLDRAGAVCVERWLRDRGVEIHTGCSVAGIERAGRKKRVVLSAGQSLTSHVVVVSTGVRPNLDFLAGSGIQTDRGVLVDEFLETSAPGVFAAGDVAQGPDLLGGERTVHAIQPTAVDHGRIAGANMAGRRIAYPGSLAMNVVDVAGLHCMSFGRWDGEDSIALCDPARPVYRKLVWEDDRLVGGILIGPAEETTMLPDGGMLKGLVQSRLALGMWKDYLHKRPWDLRRPYVASRVAERLLEWKLLGLPAQPREFRFRGVQPKPAVSEFHRMLCATRPENFDVLPRTPTPGMGKT